MQGHFKKKKTYELMQASTISVNNFISGQPLDPSLPITNAVSNLICVLAFGYRFSLEDEKFQKMMEGVDFCLKHGGSIIHCVSNVFFSDGCQRGLHCHKYSQNYSGTTLRVVCHEGIQSRLAKHWTNNLNSHTRKNTPK